MKKYSNKKKNITIILCCALLAMICAVLMIRFSISGKEQYIFHYNDYSKLDYNVYLKENQFYKEPFLKKDNVYISTLIDYINAEFNYNFKVVEDISLGYDYYVSAKLLIGENDNKKIYESEDILLDKREIKQVEKGTFSIDENIKIDYNKYNSLASTFLKKYGLSTGAKLIVSMYVDINGTYENFEKKLNDSAVVSLEIPLTTTTTEIAMNYDLKNSVNEKFEYGKTSITKMWLFVLGVIIAILDIIYVIIKLIEYVNSKDDKERYQEKLNKIFSEYGSYISKKSMTAKTKEIMYTVSLRIEVLDTFEDLINVRDSIERPILFYEAEEGKQAVFYIIDTNVSYIYILNAKDCVKNNLFNGFSSRSKEKLSINDITVIDENRSEDLISIASPKPLDKEDDVAEDEIRLVEVEAVKNVEQAEPKKNDEKKSEDKEKKKTNDKIVATEEKDKDESEKKKKRSKRKKRHKKRSSSAEKINEKQ